MSLLDVLYGDKVAGAFFDEHAQVTAWLDVEAAFAQALADAGVITRDEANAISAVCLIENVDLDRLWEESRVVGYPILPLVRQICEQLEPEQAGLVHWGATTQDIMDTGLALQMARALRHARSLLVRFGDALSVLVDAQASTVMAGRTHGQQAVPTTFGAKMAVVLDQVTSDIRRLDHAALDAATVSLYGAGGTSAALGDRAGDVRRALAARLELADAVIPWHVARGRLADVGHALATSSGTAIRLAREVVDLSRTEVRELAESDGQYRGASSTMPQKANPISAEAIIGFGVACTALAPSLYRALEAGSERAAGEWQVEWYVIPRLFTAHAGALAQACELAEGLRVFPDRMAANLKLDGGSIMAEAYMIRLASWIGRDRAHELVYEAARMSRDTSRSLHDAVLDAVPAELREQIEGEGIGPADYLGEAMLICTEAVAAWRERRGEDEQPAASAIVPKQQPSPAAQSLATTTGRDHQ